jgi:membrane protease YdiL (CAAX protease family)
MHTNAGNQPAAPEPSLRRRWYRSAECLLLFVAFPAVAAQFDVGRWLIPLLWLLTLLSLVLLLVDPTFDRRAFTQTGELRRHLPRIIACFLLAATLLAIGTVIGRPDLLFGFVRRRPVLWAIVMVLYPALSVYPQGIIYRAMFFHRYRLLFGNGAAMVVASASAFSLAHIVLHNELAVSLTLVGGLIFANTYRRTHSLIISGIEHALYGGFLFTIGLGPYFYSGAPMVERLAGGG